MRTSTVEVGGMLSPLSDMGVEKQLSRLPGVNHVSVDYATASATVTYDEHVIDLDTIKAGIRECGFHCSGQLLPKHVCRPSDPAGETLAMEGHGAHAAPARPAEHMEMGHGAGMDMQAPSSSPGVRDMRNRFWIALAFSVPIFLYSPMGMQFVLL